MCSSPSGKATYEGIYICKNSSVLRYAWREEVFGHCSTHTSDTTGVCNWALVEKRGQNETLQEFKRRNHIIDLQRKV